MDQPRRAGFCRRLPAWFTEIMLEIFLIAMFGFFFSVLNDRLRSSSTGPSDHFDFLDRILYRCSKYSGAESIFGCASEHFKAVYLKERKNYIPQLLYIIFQIGCVSSPMQGTLAMKIWGLHFSNIDGEAIDFFLTLRFFLVALIFFPLLPLDIILLCCSGRTIPEIIVGIDCRIGNTQRKIAIDRREDELRVRKSPEPRDPKDRRYLEPLVQQDRRSLELCPRVPQDTGRRSSHTTKSQSNASRPLLVADRGTKKLIHSAKRKSREEWKEESGFEEEEEAGEEEAGEEEGDEEEEDAEEEAVEDEDEDEDEEEEDEEDEEEEEVPSPDGGDSSSDRMSTDGEDHARSSPAKRRRGPGPGARGRAGPKPRADKRRR